MHQVALGARGMGKPIGGNAVRRSLFFGWAGRDAGVAPLRPEAMEVAGGESCGE